MTTWKRIAGATALSLMMSLSPTLASAQTSPQSPTPGKTHRVLFVLTSADEADWHMTLTNMTNFIKAMPEGTAEVELVAYGPGTAFLRKASVIQPELEALETRHVHFVARENSMRMQHLTAADLAPGVTSVPSGVVEVVTRQEQGWPYIKAGR